MSKSLLYTIVGLLGASLICLFFYRKKRIDWVKNIFEKKRIDFDRVIALLRDKSDCSSDLLTIKFLTDWFYEWNTKNEADNDDVGFVLKESLEFGDVRVIQGVFNKTSGIIKEARRIYAKDIDDETKQLLGKEELTIFS